MRHSFWPHEHVMNCLNGCAAIGPEPSLVPRAGTLLVAILQTVLTLSSWSFP